MTDLTKKLAAIQKTLNAPKNQRNTFGNYNYRSCEDILMAVKPLLGDLVITVNDEMVAVGDRIYVKATANITDGKESLSTSAFAREAVSKKGMDDAQVTGSTSSYARKYALNGLLLIDDNKDADHGDNREESKPKQLTENAIADFMTAIGDADDMDALKKAFGAAYKAATHIGDKGAAAAFESAKDARKAVLQHEAKLQQVADESKYQ